MMLNSSQYSQNQRIDYEYLDCICASNISYQSCYNPGMEHDKKAARRGIDALKAKLRDLAPKPGRIATAIEGVWLYRQTEDG
jgi:hypothetical protein